MLGRLFSGAVPAAAKFTEPTPGPSLDPLRGVAAGLAMAAINKLILKTLIQKDRLQLETLFSTLGALAGFAAQHAVRQECVVQDGMAENEAFLIVLNHAGERFFFGDRLNHYLVPERLDAMTVFSMLGGQAMRLGATKEQLPDVEAMFERVAKSLDAPEFGVPQLADGRKVWLAPKKAVAIFWNATVTAFTREPVVPVPNFELLQPKYWPLALATMAAGHMEQFKSQIAPAVALDVFMQAAIAMSKVDPAAVGPESLQKH
jgi:hypothetical protein